MPYLCDTNILLRFANTNDAEHTLVATAVQALLSQGEILYYAQQNRREFWNVCTRPTVRNGIGLTTTQTQRWLQELDPVFTRLEDRPESGLFWDRLVAQYNVVGLGVHDAQLVACMLTHSVPAILTLNAADFRRYAAEITVVHPRDVGAVHQTE